MKTTDEGARVTDRELAEVARLDAEATPGPWHAADSVSPRIVIYAAPVREGQHPEPLYLGECYADGKGQGRRNMKLIACARTLLPRFRDEVIALRAEAVERAEHAEALDDVLARIVAAWRDDEVGQIDGALIEEAEAMLGITPEADPLAAEPAS